MGLQSQTWLSKWRITTKGNNILSNFESCLSSSYTCHSSTFNTGIHHALQASQTWDPQHFCVSNVRCKTSRFSKDLLHPHLLHQWVSRCYSGWVYRMGSGDDSWPESPNSRDVEGRRRSPGDRLLTADHCPWPRGGGGGTGGSRGVLGGGPESSQSCQIGTNLPGWEQRLQQQPSPSLCPPPLCPHLPRRHMARLAGCAENRWLRAGIGKGAYWCIECLYYKRTSGFVKCFLSIVVPLWAHHCLVAQSCPTLCDARL